MLPLIMAIIAAIMTIIAALSLLVNWKQYQHNVSVSRHSAEPPPEVATTTKSPGDRTDLMEYVTLGEFVWYLSNPPWAPIDNVTSAIRGFLSHLEGCGLTHTLATAKPLIQLDLQYDVRGRLSVTGQNALAGQMGPIRASLVSELKARQ